MAQRITYLDIVGGLCILHICISHIVQDLGLEANMGGDFMLSFGLWHGSFLRQECFMERSLLKRLSKRVIVD